MTQTTAIFIVVFLAAGLMMSGFLWLLTRVQRKIDAEANGGAVVHERTGRTVRHETPATYTIAPITPAPPAVNIPQGPPKVSFNAVWHYIGKAVHLLIVGETHSGKSTSARAVLTGRIQAGEDIVILDPHGTPANWGGIRAVGAGRDYAAIETAMGELLAEMTRRYKFLANDENYKPRPMSIFVDEWPGIQTACKKTAAQFITELAQEGRKAGMRLVMLTQSDLVASLGIEGKGDVRSNFLMLLLGGKASARADVSGLPWPAALRRGEGVAYPAITDQLAAYSDSLTAAVTTMPDSQKWKLSTSKPLPVKRDEPVQNTADVDPELDPLWQRFLNGESLLEPENVTGDEPAAAQDPAQKFEKPLPSPVTENVVSADTSVVFSGDEPQTQAVTGDLPMDDTSVAIRGMIGAGLSRSKVIQLLALPGQRVAQFARIKQAMGESEGGQ